MNDERMVVWRDGYLDVWGFGGENWYCSGYQYQKLERQTVLITNEASNVHFGLSLVGKIDYTL